MNKPKFSVIIPIYNAKKYLPKCIDSILNQTFTSFEVLLIDDGSTDGSDAVCKSFCQKDLRVKLFQQKNQGAGKARNLGLQLACGEFICFVDADDYVEKNMLEVINKSMDDGTDVLLFGYYKEYKNKAEKVFLPKSDSFMLKIWLANDTILNFLWNKCFKTCILKNKVVFENRFAEDYYSLPSLLWQSNAKIKTVDCCLYHYQVSNSESATHTMNSKKFFQCWEAFRKNQNLLASLQSIPANEYVVVVDKCFELGRICYVLSLLDHGINSKKQAEISDYFLRKIVYYFFRRELRKLIWSIMIGIRFDILIRYLAKKKGYLDRYRTY